MASEHDGGARVHSFDDDIDSVRCTETLRDGRVAAPDPSWRVERGSILDRSYLDDLGRFDVVYAWGVLHHTGDMWQALSNAIDLVAEGGKLFIAIYNDQGARSKYWRWIKYHYSKTAALRPVLIAMHLPYPFAASLAYRAVTGRLRSKARGMSYWYDYLDWLGGYPFEVARPEEIRRFCRERGFRLVDQTITQRHGTNQFVLERTA